MLKKLLVAVAVVTPAVLLDAAVPQAQPASQMSDECGQTAPPPAPATKMETGADSGSRNMGSTGWSGGDRQVGAGTSEDHKPTGSEQPATAKGLDPTKGTSSQKQAATKPC